ncbi:hypothetical protein WICPIJ_005259 [Wickerhamomyces pijperi]|uniref:Uncharacterized protein n=1 Tax=Wickerhamomyces pijperi TaxID=599730 RepID=A0A9P8Q6B0_WICPI|nr:hypothetical protein WICPIJ_005259 [Wickerhamomyces pijperi]
MFSLTRRAAVNSTHLSLVTRSILSRSLATVKTTVEAEDNILKEQRKNRPTSPHLTIYQPQLTWYLSSVHRVSGVMLAGIFYGITCAYGFSSILDLGFNSDVVVNYWNELSNTVQYGIKGALAFPFFFHLGNGIRHLIWDAGKELTLKGVYRTGYAVLAFSAIAGSDSETDLSNFKERLLKGCRISSSSTVSRILAVEAEAEEDEGGGEMSSNNAPWSSRIEVRFGRSDSRASSVTAAAA